MTENQSEVMRLRQQVADEYQAAQWGLSGLASGTSKHQFITSKMENLGATFEELTGALASPEKAIEIMAQTIESLPETPTRVYFVNLLQRVLGSTEETTVLIDSLEDLWKTIDLLITRFGAERAKKIINLPSSFEQEKEPHA